MAKVSVAQATGSGHRRRPGRRRAVVGQVEDQASMTRVVRPRRSTEARASTTGPRHRSDHLEGQIGGGHPVGLQDPDAQEPAHHVDQRGQHAGPDARRRPR